MIKTVIAFFIVIFFSFVNGNDLLKIEKYIDLNDEGLYDVLSRIEIGNSMYEVFNNGQPTLNALTVILTQYKRNRVREQLDMIISQTIVPKQIYIYQNEDHINISFIDELKTSLHSKFKNIPTIKRLQNIDENFRYHGRFTIPLLIDTEYVAIFDDDIICGNRFIENCIRVVDQYNAICGAAGQIIAPQRKIMTFPPTKGDTEVDSLIWSWVFRAEWTRFMWMESMPSFSQAEDISFSMTLFKNNGIRSIVPHQPEENPSLTGSIMVLHSGDDIHATHIKKCSSMLRWAIIMYWINAGYTPLALRSYLTGAATSHSLELLELIRAVGHLPRVLNLFPNSTAEELLNESKQFIKASPKDIQSSLFIN